MIGRELGLWANGRRMAAMCDHPNREAAMVVIREKADGVPAIWCDPCLVDLVTALNNGGVATVASCCGHGKRDGSIVLADDRELVIRPFIPFDGVLYEQHLARSRISGHPIAYLSDGTPVVVERQFESDGVLHVEIAEGDVADRLNVGMLLRCVQEIREVAEVAQRDGVTLDPEWVYEHASIALDHPVKPLEHVGPTEPTEEGGGG